MSLKELVCGCSFDGYEFTGCSEHAGERNHSMKEKGYIDTAQCPETFHVLGFTEDGRPALFHLDDSECEQSEYDLRVMREAA